MSHDVLAPRPSPLTATTAAQMLDALEAQAMSASAPAPAASSAVSSSSLPVVTTTAAAAAAAEWTVLLAGRVRCGKTSIADALLRSLDVAGLAQEEGRAGAAPAAGMMPPSPVIRSIRGGLRLAILDSPSAADAHALVALAEDRMRRSSSVVPEPEPEPVLPLPPHPADHCIHLCVYVIDAFRWHERLDDDLREIVVLSRRLNVLPVLARADLLTSHDLARAKQAVRDALAAAGLGFGLFDNGSPYALTTPESSDSFVRTYQWGTLHVLNRIHCDFYPFRENLLANLPALKTITRTDLLAAWQREAGIEPEPSLSSAPQQTAPDSQQQQQQRILLLLHNNSNATTEVTDDDDGMPRASSGSSQTYPLIPGTSQYNLATGLPGVPKLRQKKILVACNFCRTRKLKCDGGRPACGQCVKRANHCDYQPVLRRSRKSDADTDAATGPSTTTTTEPAPSLTAETLANRSPSGSLLVTADSSETRPLKREHSPVGLTISSVHSLPPSASGSRRPSAPSLLTHASPSGLARGLKTIEEDSQSPPTHRSPSNTIPRPLTSHSRSPSQSSSSERSGAEMTTTLPPLVTVVGHHRDRDQRIVPAPGGILDDVHSAARQRAFAESRPTLPPIQVPLSADVDMAPYPDTRPRAFNEMNWSSGRRGSDEPASSQWSGEERRQSYDMVSRRQEQAREYDEREYGRYDASQRAPPSAHAHVAAQRHRRTASLPGPHSIPTPPGMLPPPSAGFRQSHMSPHHQHHALLSPHHARTHHSPSQNPQALNSPNAGLISPRERLPGIPLPRAQSSSAAAHTPMAHTTQAPHLSGATPIPPSPPVAQLRAQVAASPEKVAAARDRYADRMDVDSEFSPPRAAPSLPPSSAASGQHRSGAYSHATAQQYSTPPPHPLSSDPRIPKNPRFGPKTVACTFCRQRKTKCDGAHPRCSNCAKRGQSCEYMEDLRRRVTGPHATVDSEGWPLEVSRSPGEQAGYPSASTSALHASQRRTSVPPGPAALPGLIQSSAEARVTGDGQRLKKLTPVVPTSSGSEDDGSEPPRKRVRMDPPPTSNVRGTPLRAGTGW